MLLQFVGGRATLTPLQGTAAVGQKLAVRLVFIAELGVLSAAEIGAAMDACTRDEG